MSSQQNASSDKWNRFAAWCFVGMGVFVAVIAVVIQHWRALSSAAVAIGVGALYLNGRWHRPEQ